MVIGTAFYQFQLNPDKPKHKMKMKPDNKVLHCCFDRTSIKRNNEVLILYPGPNFKKEKNTTINVIGQSISN